MSRDRRATAACSELSWRPAGVRNDEPLKNSTDAGFLRIPKAARGIPASSTIRLQIGQGCNACLRGHAWSVDDGAR
jgi:hypothetical protein